MTDPTAVTVLPADETQELPGMPPTSDDTTTHQARKRTGSSSSSRGRRKSSSSSSSSEAKAPAAAKRPGGDAARRAAARAKKAPDYAKGVAGLLQLTAAPMLVVGRSTQNPALIADAAAIAAHAEPVADAVAELAVNDAKIAAVLDKLIAVGPYSALLGAVMPLAAQLACNHGIVAPGTFGARALEDVLADVGVAVAHAAAEDAAAVDVTPSTPDDAVTSPNGAHVDAAAF